VVGETSLTITQDVTSTVPLKEKESDAESIIGSSVNDGVNCTVTVLFLMLVWSRAVAVSVVEPPALPTGWE